MAKGGAQKEVSFDVDDIVLGKKIGSSLSSVGQPAAKVEKKKPVYAVW